MAKNPRAQLTDAQRYLKIALMLADRSKAEKIICGAIKSTVDAHGPITVASGSSAAKRIWSALWSSGADANAS